MSLFKILQWFNYQCPDNFENYDSPSLTCARLNVDTEQQKDNIIITSHSGNITILNPCSTDIEVAKNADHLQHSSIVYETKLTEPILGVLCGNFMPHSQQQEVFQSIALLHPRKLAIYNLTTTTDAIVEHGQQSKLQLIVQHDLPKMAFTFCKGNFGGVKNKEFLCVMFLDGSLKFFEQDGISQNCLLAGPRSIPAQFIYVPRTDCFIILSSSWELECYRYLSLSESFERKFSPMWSINIGEYILDINQHQMSNSESLIVLLGENSLICVSDTGKLKFVKKFDYTPLCFCSFVVGWYFEPNCKLMIAVVTDNGSLLIYHNSLLVWCAELLHETISIQRGNFLGLAGGLVALSPTGKVSVGFLGSNPSVFKVPPINLANIDYEKSKIELEEFEREINSSIDNTDFQFINLEAEKHVNVASKLQFENLSDNEFAILIIELNVSINLEQIQLAICDEPALTMSPSVFFEKDLKSGERHVFETRLSLNESQEYSESMPIELIILVSFINKQSIARATKHEVKIPLLTLFEKSSPQKDGHFKATLSLSQPIDIESLFSDLNQAGQVIGFKCRHSENTVTLITAKNSTRYRIQSSNLSTIGLLFNIMAENIAKSGKIHTNATINLQVNEFLVTNFEKYYNLMVENRYIIESLGSKTLEMRLFERCYLLKMQEKTPTASIIDILLRETATDILTLSNRHKELKSNMLRIRVQLLNIVFFLRKVIEHSEISDLTLKKKMLSMTRLMNDDEWLVATAPYVFYLNSLREGKIKENRNYENFSIVKFNKHLKNVLSLLVDTGETSKGPENILHEELETIETDSEWRSEAKNSFELL